MKQYFILCATALLITNYSIARTTGTPESLQAAISQKCQKQCKQGEKCCVIPEYNDDDSDTINTYCSEKCSRGDIAIS